MKALTKAQSATLDFMRDFFSKNDQLPPLLVIAAHFGISQNAANDRVQWLAKKDHLQRNAVGKLMFFRSTP